ncbi:hypothetical protein J4Q44_G00319160 [Coregonus suidteri]|uniref:Uncharacterized protein n=1 Tax=Coregonus suidteri TaxID=861788 RepID=A0AAN8QHW0_9TELE
MDDEFEGDPQLVCLYKHNGDVLDLQFLDLDRIVTASSTGAVTIFRHHHNSQVLSQGMMGKTHPGKLSLSDRNIQATGTQQDADVK